MFQHLSGVLDAYPGWLVVAWHWHGGAGLFSGLFQRGGGDVTVYPAG